MLMVKGSTSNFGDDVVFAGAGGVEDSGKHLMGQHSDQDHSSTGNAAFAGIVIGGLIEFDDNGRATPFIDDQVLNLEIFNMMAL